MVETKTAEPQEAMEHLALVQALSHEISSAISAIERNDLADFASRLAAQEAICHDLNRKSPQFQVACASYRASSKLPAETSVWEKIRQAHFALGKLNRVYAGVISRSQKSIGLILNLYKTHGQRYSEDAKSRSGKHTLSCEA
ncbi:MAG: hypothetical protein WAL71_11685 [Terriglobales bacterium]|jgi:hypothetical protein